MRICNVVDISIDEDRGLLEFWYRNISYISSTNAYIFESQTRSFKDWVQENIELNFMYVPKPTKEN